MVRLLPMAGTPYDPVRLDRRRWYVMAGGWTLVLVPWVVAALTSDHGIGWRLLLAAVVVAYGAMYVLGLFEALVRRWTWLSVSVFAALLLLWTAMAFTLQAGGGVLYTVCFAIVSAFALFPGLLGTLGGVAVLGYAFAVGFALGGVQLGDLVGLAAVTVAMFGMFGLIRANSQLREAREELAGMAVTAERERIARDLHDVLGHSLTTITVKTALARRLLESGEAVRAAAEVADVERLGRQALADVRATVAANRVTSLAGEIAGMAEALRAAGIDADLPTAADDVPQDRRPVFAYVLREGVTNVIRHSGAARCVVRLRPESIEVLDDGVGSDSPAGNGLTGLAERVAAVGGWLERGPRPEGGYRLAAVCRADVPAEAGMESP
ncbi:sensor histidine kinase [Pseudonocardia xishanensis]|uniref:Sensor histidine kinase n=1 Tax=Pseudonocardia xishanensis TaxID=630995 RepID=A0ABP8S5Z8_9PSEU